MKQDSIDPKHIDILIPFVFFNDRADIRLFQTDVRTHVASLLSVPKLLVLLVWPTILMNIFTWELDTLVLSCAKFYCRFVDDVNAQAFPTI